MSPSSFFDVLKAELAYIRRRRFGQGPARRVKHSLVGLALSGGGIRSATTNLGILQTLSRLGILQRVDYLCTVSGGGYIGSCLSSLLSLDNADPPRPLTSGAVPLFTTEWRQFPFNPNTQRGAAQIRHLRTHGSFLVTRKGVLKRETLRSIGQLLSGTVYHLVLTLLTLSAIALLYMTVLFYGSPQVDEKLREVTRPIRTYAQAYEAKEETKQEPVYKPSSVTEITGGGTASYTIPVVYVYPGLLDRLQAKVALIKQQVDEIPPDRKWPPVWRTALVGMLVTILAFIYLWNYRNIAGLSRQITPKAGESTEEALAVRVLRRAGWASLLAVLLWIGWMLNSISPAPPPLWLLLPIVGLASIRVTSWLLHVAMPRLPGAWTRDMRSLWGAYQATAVYALWAAIILAAVPVLVYSLREYRAYTGISGIASLVLARLLTMREGPDQKKRPIVAGAVRLLLTAAIVVGLLLSVVTICTFFVPLEHSDLMWNRTLLWFAIAVVVLVALGIVGDANRLSPHYFYRDRLAEAYLYTDQPRAGRTSLEVMRDTAELRLSDLHGALPTPKDPEPPDTWAPYHLISCAINLAASRDLTRKDRKSGYFIFSKYFCGSRHTGFRPTAAYVGGEVQLSRAVTISGAAASSGIGAGTFFAQAFATVLFNLRLGYWMPNPSKASCTSNELIKAWRFWPKWLWREVTMGTDERRSMVNLSDGGHTGDNVGIYPLLQRRCKLIIACDAEADASIAFGSFTEALRHAYIDLNIDVDIDLTMVRPNRETGLSRSHCAVGLVRYPPDEQGVRQVGHLVYLKNSMTGDEPEPVLNYKSGNTTFPHESTADQFFDDAQFESYRALGVHIAEHTFGRWTETAEYRAWR